jgi:hypothetical protein
MPSTKKRRIASSVRALEKGRQILQRGDQFARQSWGGWIDYYEGMFSASRALLSVDGYGAGQWMEDSAGSVWDAYSTAFDAYTSLLGCGSSTLDLEFDYDAEMAGPVSLDLGQPPSQQPTWGKLTGPKPSVIPQKNVVARLSGSLLTVTLVNLANVDGTAIRDTIVPGKYVGTITIGTVVVSISATFTGACADESIDPSG